MFDVGFSEMLVIAIVALIVLGPEKMPKAARFAGVWVRRARNHWNSVKEELNLELHQQQLREELAQAKKALENHTSMIEAQIKGHPADMASAPLAMAGHPAAGQIVAGELAAGEGPIEEPLADPMDRLGLGEDGHSYEDAFDDDDRAEHQALSAAHAMETMEEGADYNPDATSEAIPAPTESEDTKPR